MSEFAGFPGTVNTLQLQQELEGEGFTSFKLRCAGRYDMVVPEIQAKSYLDDENAPWMGCGVS